MTAARAATTARDWPQPHPSRSYRVHVLTVLPGGRVAVIESVCTVPYLRQTAPSWRVPQGGVTVLAHLAESDPNAYRHAEAIAAALGWVRVGQWTTRGRRPALQVRREHSKLPRHRGGDDHTRKGHV